MVPAKAQKVSPPPIKAKGLKVHAKVQVVLQHKPSSTCTPSDDHPNYKVVILDSPICETEEKEELCQKLLDCISRERCHCAVLCKKYPSLTNPLGHVVLKHTENWKNALPSPLYKSMAEHTCVALTPPHLKVDEEITCLRRDISNMVIPRPDM